MTETYKITINRDVTVIEFEKDPSFFDITQAVNEISKNYSYKKRLWMFGEKKVSLSLLDIEKLAIFVSYKFKDKNRAAFVISDEPSLRKLRVYQAYREGNKNELRSFRSIDNAREWLSTPLSMV